MEPLAVVTRNEYIESVHYGYICVVDASGKEIYSLGDPNTKMFFRSSAKPIQTLPLIQSGASDAFGLSAKELAVACSSHSGQKFHQLAVKEMLHRLGLDEAYLHCGLMSPYNEEENKRLTGEGQSPSVLHCSCSGKHAAMLVLSKFRGYSLENYEKIAHPVQQELLNTISDFAEEDPGTIPLGIDGCGAPIYLLPIKKIALSYAKLIRASLDGNDPYHKSCKAVYEAMVHHPEMVAGDYEFCTELMQVANGKLIGKVGCEAVYCLGIKNSELGICIKIVDGNERAVYPVVIRLLQELKILTEAECAQLSRWVSPVIKNNLNEPIGRIVPVFNLQKAQSSSALLGREYKKL